jgi:ribosomal protein S14
MEMTLKKAKEFSAMFKNNNIARTKYPTCGRERCVESITENGVHTEFWLQNNAGRLNVRKWESVLREF